MGSLPGRNGIASENCLREQGTGGEAETFGDAGEGFAGADLVGAKHLDEKLFDGGDFRGAAGEEDVIDPGIRDAVSLQEFLNAMPDGADVRLDEAVELEKGNWFVERDFLEGAINGGLVCGGEPDFGFFNSLEDRIAVILENKGA